MFLLFNYCKLCAIWRMVYERLKQVEFFFLHGNIRSGFPLISHKRRPIYCFILSTVI